jgi:hypothetical protein
MLVIVVLFVISCFAGLGIYGVGGGNGGTLESSVGEGDLNRVVAVVNGERVTLSRLDADMFEMIRAMNLDASVTSVDYPSLRMTVIDQMAMLKELDKESKARSISVTKGEIDATVQEVESSFPTRELFMQQMEQVGMDEKQLRINVEESMRRQRVFDDVLSGVSADESEMRDTYERIKEYAFQRPEGFMMDVAHFATNESAEATRKKISGGKEWDSVMDSASSDVQQFSTSNDRMFIPADQLVNEVESVKNLAIDKVSDVIKLSESDFMIVVKRSEEEARIASFDEVSADVEQMIVGQRRQSLQSEFLRDLRNRAVVEILDNSLFTAPSPEEPVSSDVSDNAAKDASADALGASGSLSDGDAPVVSDTASGDEPESDSSSD